MEMNGKLAKKTFNVVAKVFIEQLLKTSSDGDGGSTLTFFLSELEYQSTKKDMDHVPATKFFTTMNTMTEIDNKDGSGKACVGELIMGKDDRLFTPQVGVEIDSLKAMNLTERWPKMSQANKDLTWDYLIRLAKASAQFVVATKVTKERIKEVLEEEAKKTKK